MRSAKPTERTAANSERAAANTERTAAANPEPARVHFGGPDRPVGALRDVLEAACDAVPSGGTIDWVTYYFRDRRLADALLRARARGVQVRLLMEGAPRYVGACDRVLERLRGEAGLAEGLRTFGRPLSLLDRVGPHPHLHAKIYGFDSPLPRVFVGSFNPSGDEPELDPDVITEIGDQDRGHNLLVEHHDPALVDALAGHARRLFDARWTGSVRFSDETRRPIQLGERTLWIYPRLVPNAIAVLLAPVGSGQRVRLAMSHLKSRGGVGPLCDAARRGADVHVVLHATQRRAPAETERTLSDAGVTVHRYRHDEDLPMHAKFMLVDSGDGSGFATYGSLNFNPRSRWINHEVFLADRDPTVRAALDARWQVLEAECLARARATT